MAKITIDLSGRAGLLERHQGDLNDSTAQPHLRYLGADGGVADGLYNPMKLYGYMSPANAQFSSLTGTVAAGINSIQYDPEDDIVYLSEEGENILQLSGLDDTSLSNYLTIDSGETIKDMLLYEVNGKKALIWATDSGDNTFFNESTTPNQTNYGGMFVGFKTVDSTEGIDTLIAEVRNNITETNSKLDDGTNQSTILAQSFYTDDLENNVYREDDHLVSGARVKLRRVSGTGAGITLKLSIQADQDRNTSPYTYQGAWATSTSYSIDDTVTHNSVDYQCIVAHTSGASTEPGVGGSWENNWNVFGSPDGTDITSATVGMDTLLQTAGLAGVSGATAIDWKAHPEIVFTFSSATSLDPATRYWLVLEESGSNMTSGDVVAWLTSTNNNPTYSSVSTNDPYAKYYNGAAPWTVVNPNHTNDNRYFVLVQNRDNDWTLNNIFGASTVEPGLDSFLHLADNALVYWVAGNDIHTIDGTSTGGPRGRFTKQVLTFPSYISVVDIAETRSRMYLGIQTSDKTTASDDRTFVARRSGVFLWDRRSQVLGATDFYPTPGAKEIKNLFTSSDGSVKVISVNNSGFTEIRSATGNQFAVIHTLEKDGYPGSRRAISQVDGLSVWLGMNGIFYAFGSVAPGEPERLYKIGDMSGEANAGLATGPILVGHEESSEPRMSVLFGWTDSDPSYIVQKWYPNGDGTISSVAQTGNEGNVYTKVIPLPSLSNVRYINIFGAPTSTDSTDDICDVKIYFNQSTTPWATKVITKADMNKGYFEIPVNKQNVNFVQLEFEWPTDETLGADTFTPMYAEVEVDDVETAGGKTT